MIFLNNAFYFALICTFNGYGNLLKHRNVEYIGINTKGLTPLGDWNHNGSKRGFISMNNPPSAEILRRMFFSRLMKNRKDLLPNFSDYLENNKSATTVPCSGKLYYILAIETSCDDTCAAVLRSDGMIMSEERVSQGYNLEKFGGVIPGESERAHKEKINGVIDKVLRNAGLRIGDIHQIAVTRGPGMEICLRVGYRAALELSEKHNIELAAENHIAGHCLSPMIKNNQFKYSISREFPEPTVDLRYPYLCLLLSGGHSQIYVVENPLKFHLLTDTQDQYAGSVLDKCARELGLPLHSGGASSLEQMAEIAGSSDFIFSIPCKNMSFSQFCFSGIQTQLKRKLDYLLREYRAKTASELPESVINQLSYACQDAVFKQVLMQLKKAVKVCEVLFGINQLAIVGGVSCNKRLKRMVVEALENRKYDLLEERRTFARKQAIYMRKFKKKISRSLREVFVPKDNPLVAYALEYTKNYSGLDNLLKGLWESNLFPQLLEPQHDLGISLKGKNELHRAIFDIFFSLLSIEDFVHIRENIGILTDGIAVPPSPAILDKLSLMEGRKSSLISGRIKRGTKMEKKWQTFSTSTKYSTDNATMIACSLLEKHKLGVGGITQNETLNEKDVIPRWNLGCRRLWEVLADISVLHSLLSM